MTARIDPVVYKPGDTLLRSKPFSFVIFSSHRSQICDSCWNRIEVGYGECCMSCGVVRYCDFTCRARGQQEHYLECGYVRKERHVSDMVRLVARIWRRVTEDQENNIETDGTHVRSWEDLMDNAESLLTKRQDELSQEYKQLQQVLDHPEIPDWNTFVSICGKIITNCFCLRSDRKITIDSLHNILFKSPNFHRIGGPGHVSNEPFGIGLFLLASKFDHSCSPNCTVVFNGRTISVMAEQELKARDQPTISYVNTMLDTNTRQTALLQNWFFKCQCNVCLDTKSNGVKQSIKCSKCSSARPVDTNVWKVVGECSECENTVDPKQEELVDRYREIRVLVMQITNEQVEENTFNYLHAWCAAIMGEVCSDKDVMYIRICHYVHTICMQHKLWKPAILYGEIVLPGFIYYFGRGSKIVAALLIRLHEASFYSGLIEKGAKYLDQACDIYKIIPGENHPLYCVDVARLIT